MADVELEQLSYWRAEFPVYGGTLEQQLYAAWQDSKLRMQKYVGDFRYSSKEAAAILFDVETWLKQYRNPFVEDLKDAQTQAVPNGMALELGVEKMRQYVVAIYSEATRGLGPWLGDLVAKKVISGEESFPMAQREALDRLAAFGTIRRMDEEGILHQVFHPDEALAEEATMGFVGATPNAYAILAIKAGAVVLAVLGVAAISWYTYYLLSSKRIDLANKQRAEDCEWAKKTLSGPATDEAIDTAQDVMEWCVETTTELQEQPDDPLGSALEKILIAAAVIGIGYLGLTLLPPLLTAWSAKRATEKA